MSEICGWFCLSVIVRVCSVWWCLWVFVVVIIVSCELVMCLVSWSNLVLVSNWVLLMMSVVFGGLLFGGGYVSMVSFEWCSVLWVVVRMVVLFVLMFLVIRILIGIVGVFVSFRRVWCVVGGILVRELVIDVLYVWLWFLYFLCCMVGWWWFFYYSFSLFCSFVFFLMWLFFNGVLGLVGFVLNMDVVLIDSIVLIWD